MIGEIIAIGDELTSGRIVNTTSGFAASQLFAAGHEIFAMHTIGDTPGLISEALQRALGRVDFVIVTGGLGSTTDDLTNEAVAIALNRSLTLHQEILEKIRSSNFANTSAGRDLEKLAWLPEGAEVLNVHSRMAGYLLIHEDIPIFFLPGVPAQMRELFVEQVLPRLAGWLGAGHEQQLRHCVYRIFGLAEHEINARLRQLEKTAGLKIGYYPVDSEVHVSLTVFSREEHVAEILFQQADRAIRDLLGAYLYGEGADTLASVVGALLLQQRQRLSVAESCTGGLLAAKITEIAGSSAWFAGGVVAYANELKEEFLQVERQLLQAHGAVSEPVARAMALGMAKRAATELSLAITGIAGPGGATSSKPVGTVYMGLYREGSVEVRCCHFSGTRKQIQEMAAQFALDLLRRTLLA